MRIMANNLSLARSGELSSNVMVRDRNGRPMTTYHVPKNQETNIEDYNCFKTENHEYFASNEHVTKGPFSVNFGSIVRNQDQGLKQ